MQINHRWKRARFLSSEAVEWQVARVTPFETIRGRRFLRSLYYRRHRCHIFNTENAWLSLGIVV